MSSDIECQDYIVLESVVTDGDIPITLYLNKITGLRVVTAYIECPIVKGDLVLATEAFDDDGLPHTLEHLIFTGSEDYPYRGVLDLLANKCFASGTNASTDVDHTKYTVSTAGSDGFLSILPIYLDHILFPTLTDIAYDTEVHHVNGDGEDAGVVYCEMQSCENTGDSICNREMLRSLYPGKCGYKSDTGGIMENLRTSTNNVKVRDYHKKLYHTKNLCIIVNGPVNAEDIFRVIRPIEQKVVFTGNHKLEFDRPWQTTVDPLEKSVTRRIQYPSDSNNDGLVYIGYRGPSVSNKKDYEEYLAIGIILNYLNSTAISPIQRDFVECIDPLCSSVSHGLIENSISCFYITFENVGFQYLDEVPKKLNQLLTKIVIGEEKFDLDRLQTILSRRVVQILSVAETSPHSMVISSVIGHFLYGTDDLNMRAQEIPVLKKFSGFTIEYWLNIINKYMVGPESRYACIIGEPSSTIMTQLSNMEKERLRKQKEELKDKLPSISEKLKASIELYEKPVPDDALKLTKVPSIDNIKFHPIDRIILDREKVPFRLQYDSIKTNFVSIYLMLNTSHVLSWQERLFLPLLSEMLFESPIDRDGVLVSHERIIAELFSDTISYSAGIGISSSSVYSTGVWGMLFGIFFQVEIDKYEKAVKWYNEILFKTVFSQERIKTVATRLLSDISQYKRSGGKVMSATINSLTYRSNSNNWATNFLRQQKFLKQLLKDLKAKPDTVQESLTRIRDAMCRPENMLVHIALNKEKIDVSKIHEPWLKMIPQDKMKTSSGEHIQLDNIIPCHELVHFLEQPKAVIVGVGSVESNYLQQTIKSIESHHHPDLAAVYVLLEYLTQLEGPLWKKIRGSGLSYSYSIYLSPSDGLMHFLLQKSAQLVAAYKSSKMIIDRFLSGDDEFTTNLLESAKSILIFEFIRKEKSPAGKSLQSLLAYLRKVDINFNKEMIKQISQVTKEDLYRVGTEYLKPLFHDCERRTAICCHPSKINEIINGLEDVRSKIDNIKLDEESFLTSLT